MKKVLTGSQPLTFLLVFVPFLCSALRVKEEREEGEKEGERKERKREREMTHPS